MKTITDISQTKHQYLIFHTKKINKIKNKCLFNCRLKIHSNSYNFKLYPFHSQTFKRLLSAAEAENFLFHLHITFCLK